MKATAILGIIITGLALTACGGSGADHSTNSASPTIKPVTIDRSLHGKTTISEADRIKINQLIVNGKTIELAPKDFQGNYYTAEDRLVGTHLTHSRYGFIDGKLFSNGVPTTDMPTIGIALYNGTGFHYDHENDVLDTNATNRFTVNFMSKQITGRINHKGGIMNLSANISGNGFRGKSTSILSGKTKEITTEGAFYGPNGVEMSGYYKDDKETMVGGFGAKRQ